MLQLYNADCLDIMPTLESKSIDLILCDLPYGVTNKKKNKWDVVIPFDKLWKEYERIIKDNGAILLFGQGLFTANLMLSNQELWRYNLIWDKCLTSGHLNANRMPLRKHEDIVVFYKNLPTYNPQKVPGAKVHSRGKAVGKCSDGDGLTNNNYGKFKITPSDTSGMKYPTSILTFEKPHPSITVHPTQKPVELMEWLIKTYSNEGDTVLDNCMGSGTTGVACVNTNRSFIGIEKEKTYFEIANQRIETAQGVK